MDTTDAMSHSFILKIWLETTAEEIGGARWVGRIVHVPRAQATYFRDLNEIPQYLLPYLEEMGIKPPVSNRLWKWFRG